MYQHFAAMQKISMLELRRNTRGLVERLQRGESFTITYRNQPIGELRPVRGVSELREDDPVYRVADRAEDLGESMDASQADTLLYGE